MAASGSLGIASGTQRVPNVAEVAACRFYSNDCGNKNPRTKFIEIKFSLSLSLSLSFNVIYFTNLLECGSIQVLVVHHYQAESLSKHEKKSQINPF